MHKEYTIFTNYTIEHTHTDQQDSEGCEVVTAAGGFPVGGVEEKATDRTPPPSAA